MIVIGYQGIGKSTISKSDPLCVDLKSADFFVAGVRDCDWYKPYCNIARSLSEQGKIVFVSSHKDVRDRLYFIGAKDVVCVYPCEELKDKWIEKLKSRYEKSKTDEDCKAYANAKIRFSDNIKEIKEDAEKYGFEKREIKQIDYKLKEIIEELL